MVQQAARPLPGAQAAKRRAHLGLEQVQEARERQPRRRRAVLRGDGARRVIADVVQHPGDARIQPARHQRLAKNTGVEAGGLQLDLPALAEQPGVGGAHPLHGGLRARRVGRHGAGPAAHEIGQRGVGHGLGLDGDGADQPLIAGHAVRGVGRHHGQVGGLPAGPGGRAAAGHITHRHPDRRAQRDVNQPAAHGAQRHVAQQAGVEHAVVVQPHHPVAPVGQRQCAGAVGAPGGRRRGWHGKSAGHVAGLLRQGPATPGQVGRRARPRGRPR